MMQNSMQKARLEDTENITGNLVFPINQPMIKIGRSPKNDLVIKQNTISNKHAAIVQKSDGYFIVDLKSSNKTQLNGSFLKPDMPHKLNDGDEIKFHKFSFVFKLEKIESSELPPDDDETIFFDSSDLLDDDEENESLKPPVDEDETECFDGAILIEALKQTTPCPSVPDAKEAESSNRDSLMEILQKDQPDAPMPDDKEVDFSENNILIEEQVKAKTDSMISDDEENKSSEPIPDEDEAEYFDSATLIEALKQTIPSPSVPDAEEAESLPDDAPMETEQKVQPDALMPDDKEDIFFDSTTLDTEDTETGSSQPAIDDDETIFFDSTTLDTEDTETKASEPAPDDDETIFFDSTTLDTEDTETKASRPVPDDDETMFFDSGSLVDKLKKKDFVETGPSRSDGKDADVTPMSKVKAEVAVSKEAVSESETKKIGNYDVIKLLGKGGFGSVYKGRSSDGRPVAIKVLNPDVMDNERAVRKFFHEAINLAKMDHPNICRFIDFFPHEGNFAIVMDFIEGTDLQELLKTQNGPLPFDTARMIASQTLDALHYAHQKQVLHRDLKPENITLTTTGVAKIMDFGIARLSSSESHQTSLFMISPAYTAPERFDVNKIDTVDHRADIYALGIVFYEIFTGTHPFPTTNPTEMISAHLSAVPTPPDQIVDLPSEISDGILKALEKDPADRFEDFAEFKMEMLGEAPLRASQSAGPLEFSGQNCKSGAAFLKALSGVVKKHQKQARKITVGQLGTRVEIIFETISGNSIRITRDLKKM